MVVSGDCFLKTLFKVIFANQILALDRPKDAFDDEPTSFTNAKELVLHSAKEELTSERKTLQIAKTQILGPGLPPAHVAVQRWEASEGAQNQ